MANAKLPNRPGFALLQRAPPKVILELPDHAQGRASKALLQLLVLLRQDLRLSGWCEKRTEARHQDHPGHLSYLSIVTLRLHVSLHLFLGVPWSTN